MGLCWDFGLEEKEKEKLFHMSKHRSLAVAQKEDQLTDRHSDISGFCIARDLEEGKKNKNKKKRKRKKKMKEKERK